MIGLGPIHQGHPFVGLQQGPAAISCWGELIEGQASGLDPVHLVGTHPELADSGVEVCNVHLVGGVVLGDQAHRIGLDPQVGVLGDEHHRRPGAHHLLQPLLERHRQDVVIAIAAPQLRRQLGQCLIAAEHHLEGAATGCIAATGIHRHPIGQVALLTQLIQQPRHQASIAALLRGIPLEAVDLLHHLDRHHHVVVLEAGQRRGVMQQNVGVENEGLAHASDQAGSADSNLGPPPHLRSARSYPDG